MQRLGVDVSDLQGRHLRRPHVLEQVREADRESPGSPALELALDASHVSHLQRAPGRPVVAGVAVARWPRESGNHDAVHRQILARKNRRARGMGQAVGPTWTHVFARRNYRAPSCWAIRRFGRGARIRTGDLLRPRQARYQAAPRPDLVQTKTY